MNNTSSTSDTEPLYIIIAVIAILSSILTLSLFLFSCIIKKNESLMMFLVINMLISNLLHVVSYIINWVDSNQQLIYNSSFLCSLQSYIMIASSISQELWVATIAIIVFLTIKNHSICVTIENNLKKTKLLFILLFCVFPILLTLIFYCVNILGQDTLYCWFAKHNRAKWIVYGLRWGAIIISLFYSIQILRNVSSMDSEGEDGRIRTFGQKMIIYPLIQLIGAIVPTIYRIYVIWDESRGLQIATVVCGAIQGILYPISYAWNSGLFSFVVTGCKRGNDQEEDYENEVVISGKRMSLKDVD